jgi:DNA invertase Pin-like site-specific DNA recombinase
MVRAARPAVGATANSKLIFDMFASLAEYERSRLSEKLKPVWPQRKHAAGSAAALVP